MSSLSKVRRELAEHAAAGKMIYLPSRAMWLIDGEEAGGWVGRSLREMRAEGLLVVPVPDEVTSDTAVHVAVSETVAAELAEPATG